MARAGRIDAETTECVSYGGLASSTQEGVSRDKNFIVLLSRSDRLDRKVGPVVAAGLNTAGLNT
jgi:hypothetical protein